MKADEIFNVDRVYILGAGITGCSIAQLLEQGGIDFFFVDEGKVSNEIPPEILLSSESEFKSALCKEPNSVLCISSPSIGPNSRLWKVAEQHCCVFSEMDFFLSFVNSPEIVVTGTNGKSTVVSLISHILKRYYGEYLALGNIGLPFSSQLYFDLEKKTFASKTPSILSGRFVAEVSSYQLETSESLSPYIGILTGIEEDHLERHGTMEKYAASKEKLLRASKKVILQVKDAAVRKYVKKYRSKLIGVFPVEDESSESSIKELRYDPNNMYFYWGKEGERISEQLQRRNLFIVANVSNIALCLAAVLSVSDISLRKALDAIGDFKTLPHRLEVIKCIDGVTFINDSKSTNCHSTNFALRSINRAFPGVKVDLILGGIAKNVRNFPSMNNMPDRVFIYGDSRDLFHKWLRVSKFSGKVSTFFSYASLLERVVKDKSKRIVLFSPSGASFDTHENFVDRGESFTAFVKNEYRKHSKNH